MTIDTAARPSGELAAQSGLKKFELQAPQFASTAFCNTFGLDTRKVFKALQWRVSMPLRATAGDPWTLSRASAIYFVLI